MPSLWLRPAVLSTVASVVAHGALFGVAWALAFESGVDRHATLVAFDPDEPVGIADVESQAVPEPVRVETPSLVEALAEKDAPPRPEETLPVDEMPAPSSVPTEPATAPMADLAPSLPATVPNLPLPSRRAKTNGAAVAVSVVAPAAPTFARAPVAPSVRGSAGISSVSRSRPTNRRPAYPAIALKNGWEGTTWLLVEVAEDGRV